MRIFASMFLIVLPVYLGVLVISCTGDVCGDIWDRSPTQLLNENEFVLLAQVDEIDSLLVLGPLEYLGAESRFVIISYTFSSLHTMQLQNDTLPQHLWTCERSNASHSVSSAFVVGDTILIYGNRLTTADEFFMILSPIAPQDDLRRILTGAKPQLDWNTRAVDSTLAVTIGQSDSLKKLLSEAQLRGEVVLYCPEEFCLTMKDYRKGWLCYYDSMSVGHHVRSSEYFNDLVNLALRQESD